MPPPLPEPLSRRELGGYGLALSAALLPLLPHVTNGWANLDEMSLLAEAKRIAFFGEHLHRDFFDFVAPGGLYLPAAVSWLWGRVDVQVIRLLTFGCIALGGVLLIALARRYTRHVWLAVLPAFAYAGYLGQIRPFANHHWFGNVATLLSLFACLRAVDQRRQWAYYLSGLAAAVSVVFLVHEGAVNLLVGAGAALAGSLGARESNGRAPTPGPLAAYLSGVATVLLPVLGFFSYIGALDTLLYDTFLWPLGHYAKSGGPNDLLWASSMDLDWQCAAGLSPRARQFLAAVAGFSLALQPVLTLVGGAAAATRPRALLATDSPRLELGVLFATAAGIYGVSLIAPGYIKLLWGASPSWVLTILLADRAWSAVAGHPPLRRASLALFAAGTLALAAEIAHRSAEALRGERGCCHAEIPLDQTGLVDVAGLNAEAGPEETFFVHALASHLYYFLDARPATRYTFTMSTDLYMSAAQLSNLVDDLERRRPKFMLFGTKNDLQWLVAQDRRLFRLLRDR
ncbi:MAG: hypothetical protein HZA54_18560 [Planctomycetes bacterium]|nr:hypothetical protein [Planctomycetota bacterium]